MCSPSALTRACLLRNHSDRENLIQCAKLVGVPVSHTAMSRYSPACSCLVRTLLLHRQHSSRCVPVVGFIVCIKDRQRKPHPFYVNRYRLVEVCDRAECLDDAADREDAAELRRELPADRGGCNARVMPRRSYRSDTCGRMSGSSCTTRSICSSTPALDSRMLRSRKAFSATVSPSPDAPLPSGASPPRCCLRYCVNTFSACDVARRSLACWSSSSRSSACTSSVSTAMSPRAVSRARATVVCSVRAAAKASCWRRSSRRLCLYLSTAVRSWPSRCSLCIRSLLSPSTRLSESLYLWLWPFISCSVLSSMRSSFSRFRIKASSLSPFCCISSRSWAIFTIKKASDCGSPSSPIDFIEKDTISCFLRSWSIRTLRSVSSFVIDDSCLEHSSFCATRSSL
eukprot:m.623130 g.623130  ORF g.623130 m.623130 type:complete len:398 (+) comp22544_c0_seq6:288-1481(+)